MPALTDIVHPVVKSGGQVALLMAANLSNERNPVQTVGVLAASAFIYDSFLQPFVDKVVAPVIGTIA